MKNPFLRFFEKRLKLFTISKKSNLISMNETYFLEKFEQYEKCNNGWDELYHKINVESSNQEKELGLSYDISNFIANMDKNRYRNVLPYDQNRVILKQKNKKQSSYINASPLEIPFAKRDYILTQGPLPNTTDDFWQMVYEQNSQVVIMLSKIMEKNFIKCHSYFPDKNEPKITLERFECELLNEEKKQHYTVRQIRITPLNHVKLENSTHESYETTNQFPLSSQIIHHFQYTTWPDFGVPEHTDHFLEFLMHVRTTIQKPNKEAKERTEANKNPPIICHCSAGIGRTGTFVIVDSVLCMLEEQNLKDSMVHSKNNVSNTENELKGADLSENDIQKAQYDSLSSTSNGNLKEVKEDIIKPLENDLNKNITTLDELVIFIRKYRMGLIQTSQQLRFCWKAIVDWIINKDKNLPDVVSIVPTLDSPPDNSAALSDPPLKKIIKIDELNLDTKGNILKVGDKSTEFRRKKVEKMRARLNKVEQRFNAGIFNRFGLMNRMGPWITGFSSLMLAGFLYYYFNYYSNEEAISSFSKIDL